MSKLTHIYALTMAAISAFLVSPTGVVLLMQHPRIAAGVAFAAVLGIYHASAATAGTAPIVK